MELVGFAGYLTFVQKKQNVCTLTLPNKEIQLLYKQLIKGVFLESLGASKVDELSHALITGNADQFGQLVQGFVEKGMSAFDLPANEPERSYHLFVLGLLVFLEESYLVKSNRESGYGRYDILLIPRDPKQLGIIIELKKYLLPLVKVCLTELSELSIKLKRKLMLLSLFSKGYKRVLHLVLPVKAKKVFIKSIQL